MLNSESQCILLEPLSIVSHLPCLEFAGRPYPAHGRSQNEVLWDPQNADTRLSCETCLVWKKIRSFYTKADRQSWKPPPVSICGPSK